MTQATVYTLTDSGEVVVSKRPLTPEEAQAISFSSPDSVLAECKTAVDTHFDAVAQEQRYDSLLSIATYLTSNNELWKSQAVAFFAWRDECVAIVNDILNHHVDNPDEELPTPQSVIDSLPQMVWPE